MRLPGINNKLTMSGEMAFVLHGMVNSVLGPQLRAECEDDCLNLEFSNFLETWKSACGLWRKSGWISKRVAVAANSTAEAERARALAQPPQPNPAPTIAMSLEQPLKLWRRLLKQELSQ